MEKGKCKIKIPLDNSRENLKITPKHIGKIGLNLVLICMN